MAGLFSVTDQAEFCFWEPLADKGVVGDRGGFRGRQVFGGQPFGQGDGDGFHVARDVCLGLQDASWKPATSKGVNSGE